MDGRLFAKLRAMIGKKTAQACPECGAVMVVRQNRTDRTFFLGCNRYPDCTATIEIPESMRLDLMGVAKLPGFGKEVR